ncbi:DUF1351 domain-containing protein [Virgibacillus oceani]
MSELQMQVKTIELEPAKIEFNHEDIEKELEISLKKYEGLVFSEETATDLRKTLAELRKGKNAVDRYRIDTKKKLNAPVTEFEKKCKQLDQKFESVITPLVEQQKEFEEKRRAERLAQLEDIRVGHIENHGLDKEYHERVVIDDSLLTKSTSLKVADESLEFQVKNLKMEQDKKAADKEIIVSTVELANYKHDLSLSVDAYVRLVEFTPFEEIKSQIEQDANMAVEKREAEKERVEREKQAELERIEQEEQESVEEEKEYEQVLLSSAPASKSIDDEIPFIDDPFVDDPFTEQKNTQKYKVVGTKEELESLNRYLELAGLEWTIID